MAKKRGVLGWIGCGCLGLFLLCSGGGAAAFFGITGILRGSEPYKVALGRASADPDVRKVFGTPLKAGWWVSGSVSTSGSTGTADLSFPVRGPDAAGTEYVLAHRESGRWVYDKVSIEVEGSGKIIDLLNIEDEIDEPGVEHL